jgi:hypothetical protein
VENNNFVSYRLLFLLLLLLLFSFHRLYIIFLSPSLFSSSPFLLHILLIIFVILLHVTYIITIFIALIGTVVHSGSEWDTKAVHSELK